jgi:hypothetical protein
VIDELSEAGHLETSLEELAALIAPEEEVDVQEPRAALKLVHQLDPPGIAARSLQEQRFNTIQRVADAIVARQQMFFFYGEAAMKPMALKDIASELGLRPNGVGSPTFPRPASIWPWTGAHGKKYKGRSKTRSASREGSTYCPRSRGTPIAGVRSSPTMRSLRCLPSPHPPGPSPPSPMSAPCEPVHAATSRPAR